MRFDVKIKNNKMLFNSRNWFKFDSLMFNNEYKFIDFE